MHKQLAQDPNKAMNEIMQTIDDLRDLYVQETEALKTSDTRAFMALQGPKMDITGDYKNKIEVVLARKTEFRQADPALKQKLHDMQADFAHLADKNQKALNRMKRCTERLSSKIRSAAKEEGEKRGRFAYGQNGAMASSQNKPVSIGVSETA